MRQAKAALPDGSSRPLDDVGIFVTPFKTWHSFCLRGFVGDQARISLSSDSRRYIAIGMDNSDMRFYD